ncbi:MAG: hypothetical protein ACRETF_06305 [Nevskiaceae bacterium]
MKHGLSHAAVVGALLAVAACASKAPRGELTDTPWDDAEKLPYSEWRVVSEKPRLLQRQRVSQEKVKDDKEWSDGYVSQIELKSEDTRTIKFDLDARAPAGTQRCEKSVAMLFAIQKQGAAVRTPCEVEAGATLRLMVLSAGKGEVTISNVRAYPWTDVDKMEFTEQKVLSQNPRVTLLARVSAINHHGDTTWPPGFLAQFQIVSDAPYVMDFSAQLLTAKVGEQGGKLTCDGTALTVPSGGPEGAFTTEPCYVASKDTRSFSAVLARRDGYAFVEAHNRPPKDWTAFKDPALAGVFWRAETGARQDTIVPPDDPSKESVGYEVAVTFFNARTEPALVNFVVVPNVGKPPESMPDPNRQIGGGTATLLGGEVKKVVRASIVREWTLWVAPRKTR